MTSFLEKSDFEQLNLKWCKTAPKERAVHGCISFEEYFRFLEELQPSLEQLQDVKIYKERFTLHDS